MSEFDSVFHAFAWYSGYGLVSGFCMYFIGFYTGEIFRWMQKIK